MLIETTININSMTLRRVLRASGRSGNSRRTIISRLLAKLSIDKKMPPRPWSRIRYQKRDEANKWEESHLYLTPVEYEMFLDMKKIYKMSGSYLVSYAINKYIDELLEEEIKIADNYRLINYGLSRYVVKNIVCWTQYWGIPPLLLLGKHRRLP